MHDIRHNLVSEPTLQDLVECPFSNSIGSDLPRATVGMWAGLIPRPDLLTLEICRFSDSQGRVSARVAAEYEALEREV